MSNSYEEENKVDGVIKTLEVGIVVGLLCVASVIGGCIYVGHRMAQKRSAKVLPVERIINASTTNAVTTVQQVREN